VPRPNDKKAVQRLIVLQGCVNYLSTFMPKLSEVSESVPKLIERDVTFMSTEEEFEAIKKLSAPAPPLKYYDLASETPIQRDASESR